MIWADGMPLGLFRGCGPTSWTRSPTGSRQPRGATGPDHAHHRRGHPARHAGQGRPHRPAAVGPVGYLVEGPGLYPALTVTEHLRAAALPRPAHIGAGRRHAGPRSRPLPCGPGRGAVPGQPATARPGPGTGAPPSGSDPRRAGERARPCRRGRRPQPSPGAGRRRGDRVHVHARLPRGGPVGRPDRDHPRRPPGRGALRRAARRPGPAATGVHLPYARRWRAGRSRLCARTASTPGRTSTSWCPWPRRRWTSPSGWPPSWSRPGRRRRPSRSSTRRSRTTTSASPPGPGRERRLPGRGVRGDPQAPLGTTGCLRHEYDIGISGWPDPSGQRQIR